MNTNANKCVWIYQASGQLAALFGTYLLSKEIKNAFHTVTTLNGIKMVGRYPHLLYTGVPARTQQGICITCAELSREYDIVNKNTS